MICSELVFKILLLEFLFFSPEEKPKPGKNQYIKKPTSTQVKNGWRWATRSWFSSVCLCAFHTLSSGWHQPGNEVDPFFRPMFWGATLTLTWSTSLLALCPRSFAAPPGRIDLENFRPKNTNRRPRSRMAPRIFWTKVLEVKAARWNP